MAYSVTTAVDAPPSSWGLIIGKGGATLQKLQQDHGVRIQIPRPNTPGQVTIRGPVDACARCQTAILEIVDNNSRGKDKKKLNNPGKRSADRPFPLRCALCDREVNSVTMAFDHLGSKLHLGCMLETDEGALACEFFELFPQHEARSRENPENHTEDRENRAEEVQKEEMKPLPSVLEVGVMLGNSKLASFHRNLGFDVESLLELVPAEHARRETLHAVQKEALQLSPDVDWFRVESRHVIRWDGTPASSPASSPAELPLRKAPELHDMQARCLVDGHQRPPMVRIPQQLPAALPKIDPAKKKQNAAKARHAYPACCDGGRLGLACAKNLGLDLDTFSLLCGTAFLKALSGDAHALKGEWYLQRVGGGKTVVALHIPPHLYGQDDVGHAVERLLCGCGGGDGSFEQATVASIGDTRLLVCSELDASEEGGRIVELKSSHKKLGKAFVTGKVALQVLVNGSDFVLGCFLNDAKSHLEDVEWLPWSVIKADHSNALIAAGQRARLLLSRVLTEFTELDWGAGAAAAAAAAVVKVTFDDSKLPVLAACSIGGIVGGGVDVLPSGL